MADEPHDFPLVVYYQDGRSVTVHSPEEYDALEAGHAPAPDGPWAEPAPEMQRRAGSRRRSEEDKD